MTVLYFVRHAHADWLPDEQRPLSSRGAGDARQVAALLHTRPIGAVYASPARRAVQTVQPLADRLRLHIHTIDELRERELSPTPVVDFQQAARRAWDDPASALPGGEANRAAQQRGVAVVELLLRRHQHQHIVVATHGTLLALILQHYDASVDFSFWQSLSMPDVYRLELEGSAIAGPFRLWP